MSISTVVSLLDQEITRLQQVRSLLAGAEPVRKAGRRGPAAKKTAAAKKAPQKRTMSAEGRARIAAAQKARWAAQKKTAAAKKAAK